MVIYWKTEKLTILNVKFKKYRGRITKNIEIHKLFIDFS